MRFELIYMIIFTGLSWASDPLVKLMESPRLVEGSPVLLENIATVEGGNASTQESLRALKIADSVKELKTGNELLYHLKQQLREFNQQCNCQVQIQIPRKYSFSEPLKVPAENARFSIEKLKSDILSRAQSECRQCRLSLESLECVHGETPESYTKWEMVAPSLKASGDARVQVYFSGVNQPVEYLAKLKVDAPHLKLKKNIPLGGEVDESIVDVDWLPAHPQKTLASLKDLSTSELRRSLSAGQVIYLEDLREKHVVRAGRPVKVEIVKGNMSLETTGTPSKDAKAGEFISIRLSRTNKSVVAEVIGPGKVRIQ